MPQSTGEEVARFSAAVEGASVVPSSGPEGAWGREGLVLSHRCLGARVGRVGEARSGFRNERSWG